MPPRKALLVAVPLALASVWGVVSGAERLASLRGEMARLEAAGRAEGESFVKTLRGAHADRQLEAFDRRRALALEAARARRDQLLGYLGLAAAALFLAGAAAVRRVAREVAEDRRLVSGPPDDGGRPPPDRP